MSKAGQTIPVEVQTVTISDVQICEGEARIEDLRLAGALGFIKPYQIRPLIKRHIASLQSFGEVFSTRGKPRPSGGRPGETFYLNEEQCLFITAKSDTPRAAEITVEMARVFRAYRHGELGADATIPVRSHTRRRPAASQQLMLSDLTESRGAIILNGEIVTWDSSDFDVVRGDEVLVILSNGEIEVNQIGGPHGAVVREAQGFGPRTIGSAQRTMTATRRGEVCHLPVRYCGMIIGRVIDRRPTQKAA